MWSFLKHYDSARPGKRKTASATPAEYCYCNLNKKIKNYVLNLVNFSKFEGIPSCTLFWCMVSTFWFILDGDWSSYF